MTPQTPWRAGRRIGIRFTLALLVVLSAAATSIGARTDLGQRIGLGGAEKFGSISEDARVAPARPRLAPRRQAPQRRPAAVAIAVQLDRPPAASAAPPAPAPTPPQPPVAPAPAVAVQVPVPTPEPAPPPEVDPPVLEGPVEPPPAPPPDPPPPDPEPVSEPLIDAGFEEGLTGWNTAGVGEVHPRVVMDIVRDGDRSSSFLLTGTQDRSELILGGNGTASTAGTVRFLEGDEHWYGFSFYINSMVYGRPGAHNLIMQFKSADSGSPAFGLQLWDYRGDDGEYAQNPKGLWSHGTAMDGDRFLAPVPEEQWHDVQIHFKASSAGQGFYEVYLDGVQVDARNGVSMIVPGAPYAYIKDGIYRNGEEISGTSDIRFDAAKLGETRESVLP